MTRNKTERQRARVAFAPHGNELCFICAIQCTWFWCMYVLFSRFFCVLQILYIFIGTLRENGMVMSAMVFRFVSFSMLRSHTTAARFGSFFSFFSPHLIARWAPIELIYRNSIILLANRSIYTVYVRIAFLRPSFLLTDW